MLRTMQDGRNKKRRLIIYNNIYIYYYK